MKKAFWIGTIVVALLAMTALPALAAGDKVRRYWDSTVFALVGKVTGTDPGDEDNPPTITVLVYKGPLPGEVITVSMDGDTLFLEYDGACHMEEITFQRVVEWFAADPDDAYASLGGLVDEDGVYWADRVVIDIPLEP